MKKLLLKITSLFGFKKNKTSVDRAIKIYKGKFAFCGASGAEPTGNIITVQGRKFKEGRSVCPVMDGPSVANLKLVPNPSVSPDGTKDTVWSFFWYYDSTTTVPQFDPSTKEWQLLPPVNRMFVINLDSPSTSESNMFAMPGIIFDTTDAGIVLAKVYGPLNEAAVPLRKAVPVESGMTSVTAAKEGFPYPVGTPIPISNLSKELQKTKKY